MKPETWAPHVTVAAVVERDGRFLLVEEHTPAGLRLNQPAGHLEAGESLMQAVIRETLEETAQSFVPAALVGVYGIGEAVSGLFAWRGTTLRSGSSRSDFRTCFT